MATPTRGLAPGDGRNTPRGIVRLVEGRRGHGTMVIRKSSPPQPLVPAKAGTQIWIPAYAGMTGAQLGRLGARTRFAPAQQILALPALAFGIDNAGELGIVRHQFSEIGQIEDEQ